VPFLVYALQGFYDGLQGQLADLRLQTEQLLWRELVDQAIPGHTRRTGASALWRWRLAGTLSAEDPLPRLGRLGTAEDGVFLDLLEVKQTYRVVQRRRCVSHRENFAGR
jgi:hypothetical protein